MNTKVNLSLLISGLIISTNARPSRSGHGQGVSTQFNTHSGGQGIGGSQSIRNLGGHTTSNINQSVQGIVLLPNGQSGLVARDVTVVTSTNGTALVVQGSNIGNALTVLAKSGGGAESVGGAILSASNGNSRSAAGILNLFASGQTNAESVAHSINELAVSRGVSQHGTRSLGLLLLSNGQGGLIAQDVSTFGGSGGQGSTQRVNTLSIGQGENVGNGALGVGKTGITGTNAGVAVSKSINILAVTNIGDSGDVEINSL